MQKNKGYYSGEQDVSPKLQLGFKNFKPKLFKKLLTKVQRIEKKVIRLKPQQ